MHAVLRNPHKIRRLRNDDLLEITQRHPAIELLLNQSRIDSVREHAQNLSPDYHYHVLYSLDVLDLHLEFEIPQKGDLFADFIVDEFGDDVLADVAEEDEELGGAGGGECDL